MRLVLRTLGTWLIGLALIIVVVDGTKSLAAEEVRLSSFGAIWEQVHRPSMVAMLDFFQSRFFADLLAVMMRNLLACPAFLVLAVPGIVIALAGRRPWRERYLRQEQF